MCPLLSNLILAASLAPPISDDFDDGALDGWSAAGLEIPAGAVEVKLEEGRAVGRAQLNGEANADPVEDCKMSVKVELGKGGRIHRRACVRLIRNETAYARVTVWHDPEEKKEMFKVECGVVGQADTRKESTPQEWTGESKVKLELVAKGDQLTASFELAARVSVPTTYGQLSSGANQTAFVIEASGDKSRVSLDDFEAEWTEP